MIIPLTEHTHPPEEIVLEDRLAGLSLTLLCAGARVARDALWLLLYRMNVRVKVRVDATALSIGLLLRLG